VVEVFDIAPRDLGRQGEELASRYLTRRGMRILARNWRCELGELDIIACCDSTLVAVEVKTRTWPSPASPAEGLTRAKLQRMRRLIRRWRTGSPRRFARLRLDAVCVLYGPQGRWHLRYLQGLD
jgi:putative endonuclease